MIIKQTANEVYFDIEDAIRNRAFTGFEEDYLVLHSLLRKYRPKDVFEIGTNIGEGTNIICNAVYKYHFEAKIYSLDLPKELAHISLQHPISEGKGDRVGSACTFPYIQLRGDSMTFDFSQYPCEGFYIDGEHDYEHPFKESSAVMDLKETKLIIWHDSDIQEVWNAIIDAIQDKPFQLYRVTDTRIAYAIRK